MKDHISASAIGMNGHHYCSYPRPPRNIRDLPFDCLQHVLSFLQPIDVTALLSTCRALARWRHEESIWRRLCLQYGVSDVTHFPKQSFYYVYTRLLHQYGGLLGLWASDMPYKGNILEFRLDPGGGKEGTQKGGIWGYVWRFPEFGQGLESTDDSDEEADEPLRLPENGLGVDRTQLLHVALGVPHRPRLHRILRIGFEDPAPLPDQLENGDSQDTYDLLAEPQVTCFSPDQHNTSNPLSAHLPLTTLRPHSVQLQITAESHEGYVVSHPYGSSTHPAFPPRQPQPDSATFSGFYDPLHAMPRLPKLLLPEFARKTDTPRYPITVHNSPSDLPVPPALVVKCKEFPCTHHFPPIPFRFDRSFPPLYFPLRSAVQPGIPPSDPAWTPESLTGLWLGAYGPHGTEVLHLEVLHEPEADWHGEGKMVRATKVTGDVNVPRGTWTWTFFAGRERELGAGPGQGQGQGQGEEQGMASDQLMEVLGDLRACRVFVGQGMTSSHGFFDGRQALSFLDVAVTGPNTIKIDWHDLDHVSTYRRYRGPRA